MSSLTEIQYLQIEPSEKGTHTNESITAQKMKKSLMENFIFCAVYDAYNVLSVRIHQMNKVRLMDYRK